MSAESQATFDRRGTRPQHANAHNGSAGSQHTEFTNGINSFTKDLSQLFDHAPLRNNPELRKLALEYKDICGDVLELCSDLRELVSEMDQLKHGLGKTVRSIELLWSNAASGREHGNPMALFHDNFKKQWPGGRKDAFLEDDHARAAKQAKTLEIAASALVDKLEELQSKCNMYSLMGKQGRGATSGRWFLNEAVQVLRFVSTVIKFFTSCWAGPDKPEHKDKAGVSHESEQVFPTLRFGMELVAAASAAFAGGLEELSKAQRRDVRIVRVLKESTACIKSTLGETSPDLKNLQRQLKNVERAADDVAEAKGSGHADVDAEIIKADIGRMRTVLDELSTDELKKSIGRLEEDVKERSRHIAKRLEEEYSRETSSCTIM